MQSCSFWNQNWEDILDEKARSKYKYTSCNPRDILMLNESNLRRFFWILLSERIKFNLIALIPKRPIKLRLRHIHFSSTEK